MRALILILNADPFATIRLPPLGFVDRGTRLRAQLMLPRLSLTRANTRRTRVTRDTKGPKRGNVRGVAREGRHGGALGASNPIWISTADRAAH